MDLGTRESDPREERLVADATALADVVAALADAAMVAIDTEFVRERTYYPELCLIQIAASDSIACVDCLADLDYAPLFATLTRPPAQWVLHSARQDLEVVSQRAGKLPSRLIDTQVAAALLGEPPQLGLQDLLARVLGVNLGKEHTRTDWTRRPLPAAALRYAFDDVRFLLPAWAHLRKRLVDLGRLDWFEEDCARLLVQPLGGDPLTIFSRIKGISRLSLPQQCAAYALVGWRERRARDSNRPRRWILADEHLVQIARVRPADTAELAAIAELPRAFAARWGAAVISALASSDSAAISSEIATLGLDREPDRAALKELKSRVKARADALGIEPEVLASRRDLVALTTGAPVPMLTSGWRASVLGLDDE